MATAAATKTPTKPLGPATAAAAKTPTKPLGPAAAAPRTPTKPLIPAGAAAAAGRTLSKTPCSARARLSHASENAHPNIPGTPPPPQPTPSKPVLKSPAAAGAKSASAKKKPSSPAPAAPPPPPRERERRFFVAKKGARRRRNIGSVGGGDGGGGGGGEIDFDKCREAAREALRASQEEFFRKQRAEAAAAEEDQLVVLEEGKAAAKEDVKGGAFEEEGEEGNEVELEGSSKVGAMRTKAMAEEMSSVPDPGSGRVKHLVHAFENLLTISTATSDEDKAGEGSWALSGLQPLKVDGDLGLPNVSVLSSSDFLNAGPNRLCSSLDGKTDRLSWESRTSAGGRRSRRNSSESLRSSWNKKLKVTSQQPFKLRTEQRGRFKEQQFAQKVQEMFLEEEKKRIHIAQGLPWTTDEPECLIKPAVKERTEPVDLVLHSDVRALERAEFDQYVLERNKFAEEQRLEWERQQELEEQERIRQLRRTDLIPKAQPMPYFERPFIPKRSTKPATIPIEPKFHLRPEKLSCNAWHLES
ncbi:unnamed protein product [Urochloa humidicola]